MRTVTQKLIRETGTGVMPLWERMSIDEYAEFEKMMGAKLRKKGEIWWRQVRPYFYRPLFPFAELSPDETKGLFGTFVAIQHPVSPSHVCNSYINLLSYEELQAYQENNLSLNFRRRIRKASKYSRVCLIKNVDELIEKGFKVYLSFYKRTGYSFRKDRTDKKVFADWAHLLFRFPKVAIWGSYSENGLVGIWTNCLVEDVLLLVSALDSLEGIKLHSPELMLHTIRASASKRTDIRRIYTGMLSSKQSLNNFKIERGARVLALPAYLHLHPVLLSLISKVRKGLFERLKGMDERKIECLLKGIRFGQK